MKRYKFNYAFTFTFQMYNFLLIMFPGLFIMWVSINGLEGVVNILRMYIFLFLLAIVLGNIVHFLICLFTEHHVYIDEETITLEGEKILTESMKTEDVGLIVFDHGSLPSKYCRGIPASLTLINHDDTESLNINNPSFFMILEIKKQCKKAKFKFDNWKWYLIWCGIATATLAILSLFV